MDRKRTVHHRCNGHPHSQEQSRNSHDQKTPTAFSLLPVFFSFMLYRSTHIRTNSPAPCTIATVILCFGVCKVTEVPITRKFLAGNRYHWHLQNTGLSPHVAAMWVWADHEEISKVPISLSWTQKRIQLVPYCYSVQHKAYKIPSRQHTHHHERRFLRRNQYKKCMQCYRHL